MKNVLGLDLGPNSIGWALIREGTEPGLIAVGTRIFSEGVDAFDTSKEKSRNETRRLARSMRRQTRRRNQRRRKLTEALVRIGLWPQNCDEQEHLLKQNPFSLRREALTRRLEPHEIGRIFLHMNQRRGFLSNRKKDRADKEVEGMLAEINRNEQEKNDSGHETIGQLLSTKSENQRHVERKENDHVRGRHLSRRQIYNEFDAIWNHQKTHHGELLTDRHRWGDRQPPESVDASIKPLKPLANDHSRHRRGTDLDRFGVEGILFFQRTMYWPKSAVGMCELEPKQKRCPKADRHAERFRILQEVNNLRYVDSGTGAPCALSTDQRTLILDLLSRKERADFGQIRKKLGFIDSVKFNLERGKRASIKGMTLDVACARKLGKEWYEWDGRKRDAIVELLRENQHDDEVVIDSLVDKFGLSEAQADAALDISLPVGFVMLSRIAIDRLLPHLEKGLIYQSSSDPEKSALHAAGYLRRDELQRRLFDFLPDFARVAPADCRIGDLPNPIVKRTLYELRKVVNAIIREYGKPDEVHVEMARSLKMGREKRNEYSKRIRKHEQEREAAATALLLTGERPSRNAILKYRLWQQQEHDCMYCNKPISQNQLFGGATDIDHILPRSLTLDDSQTNKVLCHRECNAGKGQKTPYQWLDAQDPKRYESVCQRAAKLLRDGRMPYAKYRRFFQKELDSGEFLSRQLNDTAYIARATVEFLQLLFRESSRVIGLKGQLTAELRWQWGLDTILSELPDSPAWQEKNKLRPGEKNRADHRHHAIDAVVVALTSRSRLQALSAQLRRGAGRSDVSRLAEPWDRFRPLIAEHIATMNVSHRVDRKVRGALHEETLYGPTERSDHWVHRKPVNDLSASEVERIRDPAIRKIVLDRLSDSGIEIGRGKKVNAPAMKEALTGLVMPSGVPINRVRLVKPEKTIQPLRVAVDRPQAFVKPGSTHHLCIFRVPDGQKTKQEAVFVTTLEAAQRIRSGIPIIQPVHPDKANAEFVMSLSSRELVLVDLKGEEMLLQFKTAASTQGQIYFVTHTDARRSSDQRAVVFRANTLNGRKVTVDPLGRIRWAGD